MASDSPSSTSTRDELEKCRNSFEYWAEKYLTIDGKPLTDWQRKWLRRVLDGQHPAVTDFVQTFPLQLPVDRHPDEQPTDDPDDQGPDPEPHGE